MISVWNIAPYEEGIEGIFDEMDVLLGFKGGTLL